MEEGRLPALGGEDGTFARLVGIGLDRQLAQGPAEDAPVGGDPAA